MPIHIRYKHNTSDTCTIHHRYAYCRRTLSIQLDTRSIRSRYAADTQPIRSRYAGCTLSLALCPKLKEPVLLLCLTACTRLAPDEAARPRSSRYANSGSQRAHARRRGAHPTRQCSAAMSAAIRLDLLPSAAKGRPSGGSYAAAETCAEIPRRAHGGQRRMRLSMGVGHLHGAPWPCSSDMHHMVGSRAVRAARASGPKISSARK